MKYIHPLALAASFAGFLALAATSFPNSVIADPSAAGTGITDGISAIVFPVAVAFAAVTALALIIRKSQKKR